MLERTKGGERKEVKFYACNGRDNIRNFGSDSKSTPYIAMTCIDLLLSLKCTALRAFHRSFFNTHGYV